MVICWLVVTAMGQANTTLSNLSTPTQINQSLIPNNSLTGTNITPTLGDTGFVKGWRGLFLQRDGAIWFGGVKYFQLPGSNSIGIGVNSLINSQVTSQGIASSNVAVGNFSMQNNTVGSNNTACGLSALRSNINGGNNTAMGYFALGDNTTGGGNTAIGWQAMSLNITGESNTAVGSNALQFDTSGVQNCAFGDNALNQSNSCSYNSAFGFEASFFNSTGNYNSSFGRRSLYNTTTGQRNTSIGYEGIYYNTTGSYNTGVGFQSLFHNTTAVYNTGIGYLSGDSYANGSYNTFVGFDADANAAGRSNSTALGRGSRITANNQVRVGNSSITSIGGYIAWSVVSDGRYKKNIKENVKGLEFINKLRPVTYNLDIHSINKKIQSDENENDQEAIKAKEKISYTGFIAQEVERAAKEVDYDFSGVDAPKNDDDLYGLRYSEFTVPLVKAVQELSKENAGLRDEINLLKKSMEELSNKISLTERKQPGEVFLGQNVPNPFNGSTKITFSLPQHFSSALLRIVDMSNGQTLKEYKLVTKQTSQEINLQLASGSYSYSLIVDGTTIDTKKMINIK